MCRLTHGGLNECSSFIRWFEYVFRVVCLPQGSLRSEGLIKVGWRLSGIDNAQLTDTTTLLCFAVTCMTFICPSLINSALFVNNGITLVTYAMPRCSWTRSQSANYPRHTRTVCFPFCLSFCPSLSKKNFELIFNKFRKKFALMQTRNNIFSIRDFSHFFENYNYWSDTSLKYTFTFTFAKNVKKRK